MLSGGRAVASDRSSAVEAPLLPAGPFLLGWDRFSNHRNFMGGYRGPSTLRLFASEEAGSLRMTGSACVTRRPARRWDPSGQLYKRGTVPLRWRRQWRFPWIAECIRP